MHNAFVVLFLPFLKKSLTNWAEILHGPIYDSMQITKQDGVYGMHNYEYLSEFKGCAY